MKETSWRDRLNFGRVNPVLAYVVGLILGLQFESVGVNVVLAAVVFGFVVLILGELHHYSDID